MAKTLKHSSRIRPISEYCMKCKGNYFVYDNAERQKQIYQKFGIIPSDCVSSKIDGIKCPFISGKAYEQETKTQHIEKRSASAY